MELAEGLTFVKPPKRAATFGAKPTLEQLQRRLPQSDGEGLNPPPAQTKQWAVEIWKSHETQQSYLALREAVNSYNREAGSEHLVQIQENTATFIDVRDAAIAARERWAKNASTNKVLRKLGSGLDKFCQTIYHYCPIVDAMAPVAPQYAQLAWGAIRFLLIMKINAAELKETVLQKLADIGEHFQVVRCFLGLYPSEAMAKHVCGAYEAFIKFLTEAIKYYQENCIKRFFKNVTHPFALRFDPLVQAINENVAKVSQAASLGQGIAISENNAIAKQTRAMMAMGNWKLDEQNHNLKDLKEATLQQMEWQRQTIEELKAARKRDEFDPFEAAKNLLSMRSFKSVLRTICPTELSVDEEVTRNDLSRLTLISSTKGGDSRIYERLGLLENQEINCWVESRQSKFLWIDGFLARPDWTTQLSLDVTTAAKEAGNVVLSLMSSEHDVNSNLHRPVAWAWNFINQLVSQRPEYFTFEQQCIAVTSLLLAKQDFKAVWQVFVNCIHEINFGFIYLVIDNIDVAFGDGTNNPELQDLLVGLQHISQLGNRVVKILITARRASFHTIKAPPNMTIVPVAPHIHLVKGRHHRKSVLAAVRKPKTRIPVRLPDRETSNDVMLSDESSWDDEKLEEMLETTDEDGNKKKRRRQRKRKLSVAKPASESDSLDSDSDSSEPWEPAAGAMNRASTNRFVSKGHGARHKSGAGESGTDTDDSSDSLDSLDSIQSLDSLDEALKTSGDEDEPSKDVPRKSVSTKQGAATKDDKQGISGGAATYPKTSGATHFTHSSDGSDFDST